MTMDKTFNAAEAEARISDAWITGKHFAAGANAKRAETFSIVIPPPNVTGSLHMGHAFNNTLQDILVRWHRMRGFDTLWQPGTDHAGIATQMVTEREMAANGEPTRAEMGRDKFLARVWEQKKKSRGTIIGQLQRLGASCDWDREAFTMGGAPGDPDATEQNFHDAVIKVFVEMYEAGLIYRGKRLVNWDPKFETAISDIEVENIETPGHMWHFKYPLAGGETYEYIEKDEDGNVTLRETRDYISIATTRPETMLGDGAVAVNPADERYKPLWDGKTTLCEIPVGPKEHRRLIPIITDEYPDPDFGSGAVKITGAHDFNDYEVAQRGGIPLYRLMDTKAAMRADGAPYAEAAAIAMEVAKGARTLSEAEADAVNLVPDHLRGLDRFDARKAVIDEITAEGLAVMVEDTDPRLGRVRGSHAPSDDAPDADETPTLVPLIEPKPIMQPYGDRSKVVIEPMLTDQWFVDTDKMIGPAIEAVENGTTRILPEADKKVYFHWLRNIQPWCISRQLWWGHRIPVWYGPKVKTDAGKFVETAGSDGDLYVPFCGATFEEAAKKAADYYGHSAFDEFEQDDYIKRSFDVLNHAIAGNSCEEIAIPLTRDPDVLDTWFSSGLWPLGTLGWPEQTPELGKYFPTSVLITGFDILFFWVARMMMMQPAVLPDTKPLIDRVPFKDVYVHALVRDEKGKKMSKSLGNVLDPLDLIDEYGADAVRFTLASMAAMGRDLKLSTDRIKGYRNFGTKLWNAVRFAQMNGAKFGDAAFADSVQNVQNGGTGLVQTVHSATNRWIIGETARTRAEVDAALTAYRFDDAASALYRFIWNVVCDWYIEFAKPLMDGDNAEETRLTMGWVLDQCMILLHPFKPFITEDLWALTADRATMLVHADWPETITPEIVDPKAESEMRWVIAFIEAIRSTRAQMNVPAGEHIPVLRLSEEAQGTAAYAANSDLIHKLARISSCKDAGEAPKGSASFTVGAASYALPLEGLIDAGAEKARLEKSLGKLEKEIKGLAGRANNPKFAQSAPPEVVEETKANLATREAEADILRRALAAVSELAS